MSVNKAILVGNVGRDPEVRYLENGTAVAQFSLATTERGYTDRNGTVIPDRTEWHNIVLWRGLAEVAEKYVRKGSQIYVEGRISTRNYDAPDGTKRYVTEIVASNMSLLGSRRDAEGGGNYAPAGGGQTQQAQPVTNPYAATAQTATTAAPIAVDSTDDLPF